MSVGNGTVVGAPVVHDAIDILELGRFVQARSKERCGPSLVGTLVDDIKGLLVNVNRPAFSDLKHRTLTLDKVQTHHGYRHAALGEEL